MVEWYPELVGLLKGSAVRLQQEGWEPGGQARVRQHGRAVVLLLPELLQRSPGRYVYIYFFPFIMWAPQDVDTETFSQPLKT